MTYITCYLYLKVPHNIVNGQDAVAQAMGSEERHHPPPEEITPLFPLMFSNALHRDLHKGGIACFPATASPGTSLGNYLQT